MHLLALVGAILAGVTLLVAGLLSVWHDLAARDPWQAPVIKDDEGWNWSSRYRGIETIETIDSKSAAARSR